jgi:hypothetical protein
LGDGVFESFMRPKQFKTGKIVLNPEAQKEPKQKESFSKTLPEKKQSKHKFNVI